MKLTKFQHACFLLEKEGTTILVDPGTFSHDLIIPKHLDGIVITHQHPDHFDADLVRRILTSHPKATIAGPESITSSFSDYATIPATPGQDYAIGAISIRFYGGTHAPIAPNIQVPSNIGVLFDSQVYYPGDSFVIPEDVKVDSLALPVSAPWLKISETLAFLHAVQPRFAFPTHDGILSEDGKSIIDSMVSATAGADGIIYKRLDGVSVAL